MNLEKYPHYFLAVIVLYAIVLLAGLGYFVFPLADIAGAYADYYVLTLLLLLPLILLALYIKLEIGKLRMVITAVTVVDFAIILYMMFLLI